LPTLANYPSLLDIYEDFAYFDRPHRKNQLLEESALKGYFWYIHNTLLVRLPQVGKIHLSGGRGFKSVRFYVWETRYKLRILCLLIKYFKKAVIKIRGFE